MRSKKALLNVSTALIFQLIVIVCGLIIPRLIIGTFGSEVHGVVASITRFLAYITFLELGITVTMRTALYKPLADGDRVAMGDVLSFAQNYYRRIALVFILYVVLLATFFPLLGADVLSYTEIFVLVLVMSVGTFFHYYLGLASRLLLDADQRSYIVFGLDALGMLVQTFAILIAVTLGAGIHVVKFLPFSVVAIVSAIMYAYVKSNYKLGKDVKKSTSKIENRWAGTWLQTSIVVIEMTPVTVLTLLTNFKEVSVYIVYNLVIISIRKMVGTITQGFESALGSMIAKKEFELLGRSFKLYELMVHLVIGIVLSSTSFLILPFVALYTAGIADIDYIRPAFAQLLIIAVWLYCARLPYRSVIVTSGSFKELTKSIKLEILINISVSVVAVFFLGLAGVALGSIAAVGFQLLNFVFYLSKRILNRSVVHFIRRCLVSAIAITGTLAILHSLPLWEVYSYVDWVKTAILAVGVSTIITGSVNAVFYTREMHDIYKRVKAVFIRRA